MKTAMVKTSLWDDDVFYEMNVDTKVIYLLLLTSPERGVSRIFKMSDRLISARSGLNNSQIQVCKKQLVDSGLILFHQNWIILTEKSSFIQPVKGKLTHITLKRELLEVPEDVIEYFSGLTDINDYKSLRRDSCEAHVHDNDKDNDNDIDKDKDTDNDRGYRKFTRKKAELFNA